MKPLLDPNNDRFVKSVKLPPHRPLDKNLIWPPEMKGSIIINLKKGKPDWKQIRDHLSKEGRLYKQDFV